MAEKDKAPDTEPTKTAGDQADVAVQEVEEPKSLTITVRDQEFPIPPKQPSEILFSARAISRATRSGDEGAAVEAMMDMAIAYVGEEPLRNILGSLDLEEGMSVVEEILSSASEVYGSDTGE